VKANRLRGILGKRLGPLSLGSWLVTCAAVIVVAGAMRIYLWPEKTNRHYLQEIVDTGSVQNIAATYVATIRKASTGVTPTDAEWAQIEARLSKCVVKQAHRLLASGDPYLGVKADKTTPLVLAKRFLHACGITPQDPAAS
jgi:hypothetical protein